MPGQAFGVAKFFGLQQYCGSLPGVQPVAATATSVGWQEVLQTPLKSFTQSLRPPTQQLPVPEVVLEVLRIA